MSTINQEPAAARAGRWTEVLLYIVREHRGRFFACMILGLLSNGFVSAANPLALKYLFDEGIIRHDFSRFAIISFTSVTVFTLWRYAVYRYRLFTQGLKNVVFSRLCLKMLGKFYQIPYGEVIRRDQGYFLSRIYDEASTAVPLVIDTTLSLSNMIVTLVVALAVAVSISLRATLTMMVAVPMVYLLSQKYGKRIKRESVAEKEEEAKVRGTLGRAVGSYKLARVFGLEGKARDKVGERLDSSIVALFARFRTSSKYEMLSGMFMSYVENIAIVGAGYEMLVGRMSFGGFMGFMSAFWSVMAAVRGVFGLIPEMARAGGLVGRLVELEELEAGLRGIRHSDSVRLNRVSFGYNRQVILTDFELALGPGERILILGPNGSGKSTLAHLVAGLLPPSSGTTETLPLERISAVILPFDFLPGTVRENLGFVQSEQEERFHRLSRELGLVDLLDKDPSELSAGQRKRLEILMVLLKPAELFILDEPFAGIDVGSKPGIMQAILESTRGKALMVVMHGDFELHGYFDRVLDLTDRAARRPPAALRPEADFSRGGLPRWRSE